MGAEIWTFLSCIDEGRANLNWYKFVKFYGDYK